MLTIFIRTIKDRKTSIIAYCVATFLFMTMFIAMYPSIHEQTAEFDELLKAYPEGFMKAFGIEQLSFDTVEKFLSIEQYSITWPLMVCFLMISFAGMALSREIEKGTIEIMLSRPVSRLSLFFSRYLAGVAVLALFTIVSVFSLIPLANIFGVDYQLEPNSKMALLSFLFGLAVFSLGYMFSAIFSEKSKAYMLSGGILILMYVLRIISNFEEKYEDVKYASFFHYLDPDKALIDNELSLVSVLVFLSVAVICTVVGAIWFKKRDIAV
ncbi:ABC transporter permease [Patescibacteria group bacterium]|nr:ABC transporter permease [Patescibacteria group bacterium]